MMYSITKDNSDGSKEIVKTVNGTFDDAYVAYLRVVTRQAREYHVAKTLNCWRTVRLYDSDGKQLASES